MEAMLLFHGQEHQNMNLYTRIQFVHSYPVF